VPPHLGHGHRDQKGAENDVTEQAVCPVESDDEQPERTQVPPSSGLHPQNGAKRNEMDVVARRPARFAEERGRSKSRGQTLADGVVRALQPDRREPREQAQPAVEHLHDRQDGRRDTHHVVCLDQQRQPRPGDPLDDHGHEHDVHREMREGLQELDRVGRRSKYQTDDRKTAADPERQQRPDRPGQREHHRPPAIARRHQQRQQQEREHEVGPGELQAAELQRVLVPVFAGERQHQQQNEASPCRRPWQHQSTSQRVAVHGPFSAG
jgi:hypothetical protein